MRFNDAQRTVITTTAHATWEAIAPAGYDPKVMELSFSQVTAVAATIGLGRPAVKGVTPTSPQTALTDKGATATGRTSTAVAWATEPTIPAAFEKRVTCAATIGVGAAWSWPRGLVLTRATTIVLWVIATAPVLDVNMTVEEAR